MKLISILLLFFSFNLFAADEYSCGSIECDEFKVNISNNADLQNGLSTYMNYCYGCHSLQYSRYKRVADDLEIRGAELKDGLLRISMEKIIPESRKRKEISIK